MAKKSDTSHLTEAAQARIREANRQSAKKKSKPKRKYKSLEEATPEELKAFEAWKKKRKGALN